MQELLKSYGKVIVKTPDSPLFPNGEDEQVLPINVCEHLMNASLSVDDYRDIVLNALETSALTEEEENFLQENIDSLQEFRFATKA